jgi:hypothetical protein
MTGQDGEHMMKRLQIRMTGTLLSEVLALGS